VFGICVKCVLVCVCVCVCVCLCVDMNNCANPLLLFQQDSIHLALFISWYEGQLTNWLHTLLTFVFNILFSSHYVRFMIITVISAPAELEFLWRQGDHAKTINPRLCVVPIAWGPWSFLITSCALSTHSITQTSLMITVIQIIVKFTVWNMKVIRQNCVWDLLLPCFCGT
jgi:hypothetical protein